MGKLAYLAKKERDGPYTRGPWVRSHSPPSPSKNETTASRSAASQAAWTGSGSFMNSVHAPVETAASRESVLFPVSGRAALLSGRKAAIM